jgi:DNA polymerase
MREYPEIYDEIRSYLEFAERSFFWHESPQNTIPGNNEKKDLAQIDYLKQRVENCKNCSLHSTRKKVVFGAGNLSAKLLFIGEGPGEEEDNQGLPFVGRAGKLLTDIITAMGLKRDEVYICNAVKCRPPGNRTPTDEEIFLCNPYLMEQIKIVNPKIIVALGAVSIKALFKTGESIFRLRGRFLDFQGIKVMPTFHPGFLLRNPDYKKHTWSDMKLVMKEMNLPLDFRRVKNKGGNS